MVKETHGMSIVIAGEIPFLRTLLRMAMEEEGIRVIAEADDRESLLAICTSLQPDMVLLDLDLGEIDTIHLIETVLDIDPLITIIAVSQPCEGFGEKALCTGARAYLQKPFTTYDLLDTIWKVAPILKNE
jgi:CheY-like chemotaxis protein